MDKRHRRAVAMFVVLCTMSFFTILASPASAAPGASNVIQPEDRQIVTATTGDEADTSPLHGPGAHAPGDADGETEEHMVISDVTTVNGPPGYPLRSIGLSPQAKSASWWDCKASLPAGTMPAAPDCTKIVSDTTPITTIPATGFVTLSLFDGAYASIPTAAQFTGGADANAPRDIIGVACDATPQEDTPTAANCTGDREGDTNATVGLGAGGPNVHLDASLSTSDHTSAVGPTDGGDIMSPPNGARVPVGPGTFSALVFTSRGLGVAGVGDIDGLLLGLDDSTGTVAATNAVEKAGGFDAVFTDPVPNDGTACVNPPAGMDCWSFDGVTAPLLAALITTSDQLTISAVEVDDGLNAGDVTPGLASFGDEVAASDAQGGGGSGNADCEDDSAFESYTAGLTNDVTNAGDDCVLDIILLTTGAQAAEQVHAHNDEGAANADGNATNTDTGPTLVQNANRKKIGNVCLAPGVTCFDPLVGAVFTQFADPDGDGNKDPSQSISGEATWELAGTGGATPTFLNAIGGTMCGGTGGGFGANGLHDHDNNGTFEHCHFNTSNTGGAPALYTGDWRSTTVGTVTATFCTDPEQDATGATHGCSDATGKLKDTVIKQVGENHAHVCQDISGANPHNCPTTIVAPASSLVNLRSFFRGPGEQGLANRDITWIVNPANDPNDPGQLQSRDEFTNAQGEAKAGVTSASNATGKTSTIQVGDDLNGNGIIDAGGAIANIQINWTGVATPGDCPPPYKLKKGNKKDNKLRGTATCDKIMGKKGNDVLRGRGEDDRLIGGSGFDRCYGGPGRDRFKGCEIKKQ